MSSPKRNRSPFASLPDVSVVVLHRRNNNDGGRHRVRGARSGPAFCGPAALTRAKAVMPDGVPMAWMAGLYAHAPIFVAHGPDGVEDQVGIDGVGAIADPDTEREAQQLRNALPGVKLILSVIGWITPRAF